MQGAAEEESQGSAFLRQALLEAGFGVASLYPRHQFQPSNHDDYYDNCPCGASGTTAGCDLPPYYLD